MAAPLFPANAHRHDPYRTFKFQILIDSQPVAGLRKMSALKKSTEAVDWRTGGDPTHVRKLPGGTSYEAITLEQGLTHDPENAALINNIGNIYFVKENFEEALASYTTATLHLTSFRVAMVVVLPTPVGPTNIIIFCPYCRETEGFETARPSSIRSRNSSFTAPRFPSPAVPNISTTERSR